MFGLKKWWVLQHVATPGGPWVPMRLWTLGGHCLAFFMFRARGPFPDQASAQAWALSDRLLQGEFPVVDVLEAGPFAKALAYMPDERLTDWLGQLSPLLSQDDWDLTAAGHDKINLRRIARAVRAELDARAEEDGALG